MKPGELAKQTKSVQVNQVVTYIVGKSTSIIVNRTLYPRVGRALQIPYFIHIDCLND